MVYKLHVTIYQIKHMVKKKAQFTADYLRHMVNQLHMTVGHLRHIVNKLQVTANDPNHVVNKQWYV